MTMTLAHEEVLAGTRDEDLTWQPRIFDPSDPGDEDELHRLRTSNRVWRTTDTLAQQVRDLAETRLRKEPMAPEAIEASEEEVTGRVPLDRFGRWVYYPWSGRLVHLLPPAEFRELRLDRNRHKVTRGEQAALDRLTVGIVGLSVGNAIANTLALEGACGHLRLADFDHLSLSNMNRIRSGVDAIGLPKTVLAARQILELDPYVSLSLCQTGLAADAIDEFLNGPPAVDVVIDECDDVRLKMLLREVARSRGLPVLMATSDRGMMDVERFDLEPDRPLFHGLAGDVGAATIPANPSREEKVKLVTAIIGLDTLSARIGASMLEIGETISTWPQLGADVTLGGAAMTVAVRRLALGQPLPSGRRYLDLEEALTADLSRGPTRGVAVAEPVAAAIDDRIPEFVRFVVGQGLLAPSGGNCQPWQFVWDGDRLLVVHDRARSKNLLDVGHRASYVALGAAIENIRIAAAQRGFGTSIEAFPSPGDPTIAAALMFAPEEPVSRSPAARLFPAIARRATNRRVTTREPLGKRVLDMLTGSVDGFGVGLDLLTDEVSLAEVGRIAGAADRIRFFHPDLHAELISELRWSPETAEATRDGVDLATLELKGSEVAAMRLVARADVAAFLRDLQTGGRAVEALAEKAMRAASAVALVTADGDGPGDLLQGGQAVERLWLTATDLGLAVHPWTTATYLVDLVRTERATIFTRLERERLHDLGTRLDRLFPRSAGRPRLMLARIFVGEPPSARALRLPLERVLRFGSPDGTDATAKETPR